MADRKITVYFVRHAESARNASLGMDQPDETTSNGLTDLGKRQAWKLGEHLQNEKFSLVYSSDYLRAVQTAECVLEKNGFENQPNIRVSEKLRDLDFGALKGASYAAITGHFVKSGMPLREWTLPDGESYFDTGIRMARYFEQICETAFNSKKITGDADEDEEMTVLIVSHSLSLAAIFHYFSWTDHHEMVNWNGEGDVKVMKNAGYYKLNVSRVDPTVKLGGRLKIEVLEKFAAAHLEPLAKDLLPKGDKLANDNKENGKGDEEKQRLRRLLATSKKGKEILNCCQQ